MIIKCTLCPFEAKSLNIIQEDALGEIGRKLATHLSDKHQEATVQMAKSGARVGMLGMWLMLMNLYANIPKDEGFVLKAMEDREDEFMGLLGFDREPEKENPEDSKLRKYINDLLDEEREESGISTTSAEKKGMLLRITGRLDKICKGEEPELQENKELEEERSEAD